MNSDSYHHLICIIQISTTTADYVIDALQLYIKIRQYLAPSFENPDKLKVFHSSNDLLHIQRNFGIFVTGYIDTQEAFELLRGTKQIGFDKMAKELLGRDVEKLPQLADWRLSPLPDDLIVYAAADTRFLFECWLKLKYEAVSIEREEFPASKKASLKVISPFKAQTAERAWQNYVNANPNCNELLTAKHKTQFMALFIWRDAKGKEHDIHPNKIIKPKDLENLISHNPTNMINLRQRLTPCKYLGCSYYPQILDIFTDSNEGLQLDLDAIPHGNNTPILKLNYDSMSPGNP
ncbi:unnamed protein product [Orchesella dallaii]|uniref:3'-5' exonuclease domain-containing protein n=1 Tax=Orchesella dallaii TaxID=48710 RepID=A0ABP1RUC9_9HEXA